MPALFRAVNMAFCHVFDYIHLPRFPGGCRSACPFLPQFSLHLPTYRQCADMWLTRTVYTLHVSCVTNRSARAHLGKKARHERQFPRGLFSLIPTQVTTAPMLGPLLSLCSVHTMNYGHDHTNCQSSSRTIALRPFALPSSSAYLRFSCAVDCRFSWHDNCCANQNGSFTGVSRLRIVGTDAAIEPIRERVAEGREGRPGESSRGT